MTRIPIALGAPAGPPGCTGRDDDRPPPRCGVLPACHNLRHGIDLQVGSATASHGSWFADPV